MGWLNKLFRKFGAHLGTVATDAEPPEADLEWPVAEPRNPAGMHTLGSHMLVSLLEWAGQPEHRDRIETVHEEAGRLVMQILPLRVEVFDLGSPIGQFLYAHLCGRGLERDSVFAVGPYRTHAGLFGVFAYSPLIGVPDHDFVPAQLDGVAYDGQADWARLASLSREQDLAYAQPWLKRLYLESVQLLLESALQGSASIDVARRLSVLRDVTFTGTMERMRQHMVDHPQFGEIERVMAAFTRAYADQQREHAALRENPLVWLSFAAASSVFTFFHGSQLEQQVRAALNRGDIVASDVEQARDLVDLATQCLTREQAIDAAGMAGIVAAAARCMSDDELAGYAFDTCANFHMNTREPPELDLVIGYFKEARERFKKIPKAHAELDAVRANIKRLGAMRTSTHAELRGVEYSTQQSEALEAYQDHVNAERYEKALACLNGIAKQADGSVRIELESMCGLMLLQLGRLPEAYKRRNRCDHLLRDTPECLPQTGTFEVFCSALLYKEGQPQQAAAIAAAAMARIEHVCSLSTRTHLAINLSAAQLDFDPHAAADTAAKYERTATGVDKVYLWSNHAGALLELGDVAGAEAKARDCLEELEGEPGHVSLRFDLYARLAQCATKTPADPQARERGLAAVNEALALLGSASDVQKRNLYRVHAELAGAHAAGNPGARAVLELAAAAAEDAFIAIARVEDDVNHQKRLLTSYRSKLQTFGPFDALFDLYIADQDWQSAMAFAQRFKSRFLNEAYFAISENLCAQAGARELGQDMQSGGGMVRMLEFSLKARELDADAWQGALRAGLQAAGIVEPGESMLQPISLEQTGTLLYMMCVMGYRRAAEYAKILQCRLAAGRLPPRTALLEIVPLCDGVGVLALTGDAQVRWVNRYQLPGPASLASDADSDRMARRSNNAALLACFEDFSADLQRCLPADTAALVICPSSSTWSIPFAAVPTGDGTLVDRYRLVHAPSAAFHSLAAARVRNYSDSGFALVDPQHDLQFAAEEMAMLAGQAAVKYGAPRHRSSSPHELRSAVEDKFWLHISAHGSADLEYCGMASGLNVYPPDDPASHAGLGLVDVLLDPFPGLACGVAVLSACHGATLARATEEPVGVATALLLGGAKAVVAPLWEVDEFATILFFRGFYASLARDKPKLLSQVLREAQVALRDARAHDVLRELDGILATRDSPSARRYRDHIRVVSEQTGQPYADPYYWSGFVIVGADVHLP